MGNVLSKLVAHARKNNSKIKIVAGSGINIENIKEIINKVGTSHIHVGSGATSDIKNIANEIEDKSISENNGINDPTPRKSFFALDRRTHTIDPRKVTALRREV